MPENMPENMDDSPNRNYQASVCVAFLMVAAFFTYFFSNRLPGRDYDYTFRIAGALLQGELSLAEKPPEWLNEMVPLNGRFYSVFPLGSVLSMLPAAALKKIGLIESFPGVFLAGVLAALAALLLFLLSGRYQDGLPRRIVMVVFPVFGTWMWANLAFGGAWQIALGLAVAGQLAALYFILIKPRPFLAGLFFTVAFGNRTEIILLAPLFIYLINRIPPEKISRWQAIDRFLAPPIALGVATLIYNYARFSSPFDFGYARIPGVLNEPWYQHGIFSLSAIPGNAHAMLIEKWRRLDQFPYLVPTGFGGSIFLSSPYLILLFRPGARDRNLRWLSWGAIGILTIVLWVHGNPGGWQFSYRYAMELLPWAFLILLENSKPKVSFIEAALLVISIAINAYGTWLFLRTNYINL